MKRILTSFAFVAASLAFAQVSITGEADATPRATLDIKAIPNSSTPDGILIPNINKGRAQSMTTPIPSTLVYIDDISGIGGERTVDVDAVGFYYFNEGKWVKIGAGTSAAGTDTSLYAADGVLEANRSVNQNNNNLTFTTGTGALEINGTSRLNGASYVNTTVVGSGTSYTVSDTDYYVSISSSASNTGGQFNVYIPAAAESNKGRVLIISNRTGAANLKLLVTGTEDQIINGSQGEVIPNDNAEWIVSDGEKWFNLVNF